MPASVRNCVQRLSLSAALAAFGVAGCGAAPTVAPAGETSAAPVDPAHFSAERFDANVRTLVALGARTPGSEALARGREWAHANAHETQASASIVLVAPLTTRDVVGAALAEDSSGAAFVLEAARALAARGEAIRVALHEPAVAPPVAGAALAVYVRRACGMPQRRDLLSHRVLRERFFRAADAPALGFEQANAPHAALLAAGAKRVVALDAFAAPGGECQPAAFGDAILQFVSDARALLARGSSNSAPPPASQGP